jgi:thiol-disulfide isomerase/thioredoxin
MKPNKVFAAAVFAAAIAAAIASSTGDTGMSRTTTIPVGVRAPYLLAMPSGRFAAQSGMGSLERASKWLNSPPLTASALRGKVVLINVWTYTCINWLRQAPYLRAWAEKYRDQGLLVIGVHAPEFSFERNIDNVHQAARDMGLTYPIAIDNDFAIWRAFKNQYWPALYFVDAQGRLRHHQFGEGSYEQSERFIQKLLAEGGANITSEQLVAVNGRGVEAAADWANLRSPENYVGFDRTVGFASTNGATLGKARDYAAPAHLRNNHWALSGEWTVQEQAAVLSKARGRIAYSFHARDLHLVMGPAVRGTTVRFRVLLDGRSSGDASGVDVDDHGMGTVQVQRLYHLVRQPRPIGWKLFEIEFLDPGVEIFAFTFG